MDNITNSLHPKLEVAVKKSLSNVCIDETFLFTDFLSYYIHSHTPEAFLKDAYKDFVRKHTDPNQFWKKDLNLRTYACVMRFFKKSYFWTRIHHHSDKISAKFTYRAVTARISLVSLGSKIPVGDILTEIEFSRGPERRIFHIQPLALDIVSLAPKYPKFHPLSIKRIYNHIYRLPYSKTKYSIRKFDCNSELIAEATWNLNSRTFIFFKPGSRIRAEFDKVDICEVSRALSVENKMLALFHSHVDSIIFRIWDIRALPQHIIRDAVNLLRSFNLKSSEKLALIDKKPFEKRIRQKSMHQLKEAGWIRRQGEVLGAPLFVKQILYYQKHKQLNASL